MNFYLGVIILSDRSDISIIRLQDYPPHYRIETADDLYLQLVDNLERITKRVSFALEDKLQKDLTDASLAGGEVKIVIPFGALPSDDALSRLSEFVIQLSRQAKKFSETSGLTLMFSAQHEPESELVLDVSKKLREQDQQYFDISKVVWDFMREETNVRLGEELEGDELANFVVNAAIDDEADQLSKYMVALGVWAGDQMIANDPALHWAVVTSGSWEPTLGIAKEDDDGEVFVCFPFSAVRKRLDEGEQFDARGLVETLILPLNGGG